ncbi:uncharacterized protein [Diadema antillarum]|uniref:uncharacterized protein n=1 Tax=Diadema antillarum TaxID=105358 RepID=UPI003A89D326
MMDREGSQKGHKPAATIFGSGTHELKLGKSFQQENSCGFHTIRYDFKPASVDHSREAALDVGENSEVNITFPNIENKGPESTVFGGSKKPYQKECVLIFDHRTGEFTLERLSCNIQVKRQRQEGTSKAKLPPSRPLHSSSKSSPNPRSSSKKKETITPTHSPAAPPEVKVERSPAPQPSPLATSQPSPAPGSVPSVAEADKGDESSDNYMSHSDSDDDDSSSSSSESSSSDNEEEDEEEDEKEERTRPLHHGDQTGVASRPSPMQPSPQSRLHSVSPQFIQLSEDLQLSESGSDSDSD